MNEVEKGDAEPAIPLGVADDEAEVAFDEPAERFLIVVALDAASEVLFLLGSEAWKLGDGPEVGLQGVCLPVFGRLPAHRRLAEKASALPLRLVRVACVGGWCSRCRVGSVVSRRGVSGAANEIGG